MMTLRSEIRSWTSDRIKKEKGQMAACITGGQLVSRAGISQAYKFIEACDSELASRRNVEFTAQQEQRIKRAVTAARKKARLEYADGVRGLSRTDTLNLLHQGIQFLFDELLQHGEQS